MLFKHFYGFADIIFGNIKCYPLIPVFFRHATLSFCVAGWSSSKNFKLFCLRFPLQRVSNPAPITTNCSTLSFELLIRLSK